MCKYLNLSIFIAMFTYCLLSQAVGLVGSEQPYADPYLASQWVEGKSNGEGTSKDFLNKEAGISWSRSMGDWCDREGKLHGNNPYAVLNINNKKIESWSLDVTELVNGWAINEYPNLGFMIRGMGGNGTLHLHSREANNESKSATLHIQKLNGQEQQLKVAADTFLTASTTKGFGNQPRFTVSPVKSPLLRFNLEDIGNALLSKAVLTLYTKNFYGNNLQIGVFRICSP